MKQVLYHITDPRNANSIIKEGLLKNKGKVFLFEDVDFPYCEGLFRRDKWSSAMRLFPIEVIIAKNQLFLKEYALFEVEIDDEKVSLYPDMCGEKTSIHHRFVIKNIPSCKVRYLGTFEVKPYWEYEKLPERYELAPGEAVFKLPGNNGYVITNNRELYRLDATKATNRYQRRHMYSKLNSDIRRK